MAASKGLGFRQALAMTQASTALATISPARPEWPARTRCRSWGFASTPVGLAVAVTGIWNQLANLTFPVVALALLTRPTRITPRFARRRSSPSRSWRSSSSRSRWRSRDRGVRAASAGGPLASSAVRDGSSGAGRSRGVPSFVRFRAQALGLLRRRWHVITLGTLAGPPDGVRPPPRLFESRRRPGLRGLRCRGLRRLGARSILGAMPLTPAGVGIVEIGLTGALVAFGASNAEAVTATLLYRALSVLPTLALGLLAAATCGPTTRAGRWRGQSTASDSGTTVRGRITSGTTLPRSGQGGRETLIHGTSRDVCNCGSTTRLAVTAAVLISACGPLGPQGGARGRSTSRMECVPGTRRCVRGVG